MSQRSRSKWLILEETGVLHTSNADAVGDVEGVSGRWELNNFKSKFDVRIVSKTDQEMEFDLIGLDASISNAIRRVMMSEVPSMAVEKVIIMQNSSVIQDEVLAHRLGLLPLKADPKFFQTKVPPPPDSDQIEVNENDSLEFELKIKCSLNPKATKDMTDPDDIYLNHIVKTSDVKWLPIGLQSDMLKPEDVGPVENDVVIAKLRPGHEIDLKMVAWKGVGKDHAKFMPATVWYRLLPEIRLKEKIEGERAYRLQKCFSPGVISVETNEKGVSVAKVSDARYDSNSRNVFFHEDLKNSVEMGKILDHFIFHVESFGAQKPETLVCEAIKIMMSKCTQFLEYL
ncbi:unnamed protein product [Notodromas monacha]|uniref:DNA-directed RNA polymerases I and III subunit RPAC1 n=1 Tax=Notodromas monacha TaxID=399045 RepID=A0A7R9GGY7_9CRUS|nr:unnamed protein product [Notodromas monacha]CAG0922339.1 unnamed protein product [Notodromas monacha]